MACHVSKYGFLLNSIDLEASHSMYMAGASSAPVGPPGSPPLDHTHTGSVNFICDGFSKTDFLAGLDKARESIVAADWPTPGDDAAVLNT